MSDPAAAQASLLAYFNAGGTPDALSAQLDSAGFTSRRGDPLLALDLNGDFRLDLVIAFPDPAGPQGLSHPPAGLLRPAHQTGRGGWVMVLLCLRDQYTPSTPAIIAEPDGIPVLHDAAELTGDSSADLLIGWETCGAHTCFERFEVLTASGQVLLRLPVVPSEDLPSPEVDLAAGETVEITATGIASVGAGPFRRLTRSWDWDPAGQGFRLVSERVEPPRYRFHVVLDADAAAQAGDFRQALDLYQRVALDDSLLDWVDPEAEQANLIGYSMFRVVLTYLQINDEGDAQKAYAILQNQYPAGAAGQAYAAMAQAFWEAYAASDEIENGCQAARDFADTHPDEVITPLSFGYANPVYTSADICPADTR